MEAAEAFAPAPASALRPLARFIYRRPRLAVTGLLAAPLVWLVIGYLGSLAVLLVSAFWTVSPLTGLVSHTFTLDNFKTLVETSVYRSVAGRTVAIAAAVTVTDALLAFPVAF